jgi:hypothetical protein
MSLAIAEVRNTQCVSIPEKIPYTCHPQRFEIQQMAGVLLGRPFVSRFGDQEVARYIMEDLFEPCWSAPEAYAEVRILLHGKRKLEFSFKPNGNVAH